MKKGFTMIELVFVIVIIGVLAAIAIPKLTDTKDAADGAKIASNLATCINEAGSEFMVKDEFTVVDSTTYSKSCESASECYGMVGTDTTGVLAVKNTTPTATATGKCKAAQLVSDKAATSSDAGENHVFK